MSLSKWVVALSLLFISHGCAGNPWSNFYHDQTGGIDTRRHSILNFSNEEPKIFRGTNIDADNLRMIVDGYSMVGSSSFNAGNVSDDGAISQARKVHASVVFIYSKHTDTQHGSIPLITPDTKTSTTSLYGNNFSGTAYTTTYGTKTTQIPYSVRRHDYMATYWVKIKLEKMSFGVNVQDITPEISKIIESNKGVLIFAVMKNTPAYEADILRDDIVRKINNIVIKDVNHFLEILKNFSGKEVQIKIFRNNKDIIKTVKLN